MVAAVGAAGLGAKVALIGDLMGGDYLNVGCIPSKTLSRSVKVVRGIYRAAEMDVNVPDEMTVDFGKVMERMRRIRSEISHHDSFQRIQDLGIDVFKGSGRFSDANTIQVVNDSDIISLNFKKALISTCTRQWICRFQGLLRWAI